MVSFRNLLALITMTFVGVGLIFTGCTRDIAVPVSPTYLNATPTDTAVNTGTFTFTPTATVPPPTSTFTLSPTPTFSLTPAPTNTFTTVPTNTFSSTPTATGANTATFTNTFTFTSTGTPTATGANTATFTFTPTLSATNTAVNTATGTATSTATSTPCNPASAQATYTFDSSVDCWAVNPASTPYVTSFGLSSAQVHGGANALKIAVDNTSGSAQGININLTFAAPTNLAGKQLTAWVYVDASLAASDYSSGVQPYDQTGPNWGSAVYEAPWFSINNTPPNNVGVWMPITIVFGATNGAATPSSTLQIGIQLSGVPAGAIGNFYIDDVQISAAPPTPTGTPTGTPTNTVAGPTSTPTNTASPTPTFTYTNSPTPTPTSGCTPVLFNGCESLGENGTWSGTNSTFTITATNHTQGSSALDVNITTGGGYNQNFMILNGFRNGDWTDVTQLQMDVTVDPSVVAGSTYAQMLIRADSNAAGIYYQPISADTPALVAGTQTLTWNIDFSQGTIPAGMALAKLTFIYNNNATTGLGNIYVDNIRLVKTCPSVMCSTVFNGCESLTENGNWTGANATHTLSALNVTQGSSSLDTNITTGGGYNQAFLLLDTFKHAGFSDYKYLVMDVTVDPSVVAGSTYAQLLIRADSNSAGIYYQPISADTPAIVAGSQSVTWAIDYTQGTIPVGADLAKLTFIYNNNATTGLGNMYIDNIRLLCQ